MRLRIFLSLVAVALALPAQAVAGGPFETAIFDPAEFEGPQGKLAIARVRAAGAKKIRLQLRWTAVAPDPRPADFAPADHEDPRYNWASFDRTVGLAVAAGLEPIANLVTFPRWARLVPGNAGAGSPDPEQLALFARAAARRYDGSDPTRPRIRYWQIWNEPNISVYVSPQFEEGRPVSPSLYRQMVNSAGRAIHAVRGDNVVIAGGLSPFTIKYPNVESVGPLRFMRELLCMSAGRRPRPTCDTRVEFDVWAHHPYTSGGPTQSAANDDDVSLGDLGEMRALLDAAVRARQVRAARGVGFWVTEFSWDSKGPDPNGVPLSLHARWVAEALYRMWTARVSLVTWFSLRDDPYPSSPYQSGLYFRGASLAGDRPKPALRAFRFPFVAFREATGVQIWARTPRGKPGTVIVERKAAGSGWRRVTSMRTNGFGIVSVRLPLRTSPSDSFRARTATDSSVPFSLTRPPDRIVRPFG